MVKTVQMQTLGSVAPVRNIGDVRSTTDRRIIMEVVSKDLYLRLEEEAATALFPECPELALMHPVLSFNTSERARVAFYESMTLGKLDENPPDLRQWVKKLPEDDGIMYQKAAKLCKWT